MPATGGDLAFAANVVVLRLDPAWLAKLVLEAVAVDLVNSSRGGPLICRPGRVVVDADIDAVEGDGLGAPALAAAARARGPTEMVVPCLAAVGLRAVGPVVVLGGETGRRVSGAETDLIDEAREVVEAEADGPRRSRLKPFASGVVGL